MVDVFTAAGVAAEYAQILAGLEAMISEGAVTASSIRFASSPVLLPALLLSSPRTFVQIVRWLTSSVRRAG